jgi:hypothetical protein
MTEAKALTANISKDSSEKSTLQRGLKRRKRRRNGTMESPVNRPAAGKRGRGVLELKEAELSV